MPRKEKGAGTRKYGRNSTKCLVYHNRGIRDRNKKRRILAMMRRFPKYRVPPGWKHSTMTKGDIVRV